jgi:predicted nucleic-acid-binding protein
MIGLDTNVLVRYLTEDDPIQSPKAADLIERALTESEPGYISIVAMVETTWVLERTYEFSATDIAVAIERMLQAPVLTVESEQEVFTAMIAVKEHRASFSDALIGALGARAGCARTVTFDRRAARLENFQLL